MKVRVGSKWYTVKIENVTSDPAVVFVDGQRFEVNLDISDSPLGKAKESEKVISSTDFISGDLKKIYSPMPGTIISILVKTGEVLTLGQDIMVLESMKMQQTFKSNMAGTVSEIKISEGDQVLVGDVILLIK